MDWALILLAVACIVTLIWLHRKRVKPLPQGWIFGARVNGRNASIGMGERPELTKDGFAFDFPDLLDGEVHAVTRECAGLTGNLRFEWFVTGGPFIAVEQPFLPATVSIYLHTAGQDWRDPNARWYAPEAFKLIEGRHSRSIPLTGWRNVDGRLDEVRFVEALRNVGRIGIAFGSRDRRSHGVAGTGRFELLALEVAE